MIERTERTLKKNIFYKNLRIKKGQFLFTDESGIFLAQKSELPQTIKFCGKFSLAKFGPRRRRVCNFYGAEVHVP